VARIDELIKETEEYANRPDFVISAIRNYLNAFNWLTKESVRERSVTWPDNTADELIRVLEAEKEDMLSALPLLIKHYDAFKGEPTRIIIRMPVGFRKRWEIIKETEWPIKNYQDFIRISIILYVDKYEVAGFLYPA
jgi:Arc/MetJ-type ribon-helix-helix transcriptional regulator